MSASRHLERLGVRVHRDELHALQAGVDHAVHGVRAAAAYAYDLYDGQVATGVHRSKSSFVSHGRLNPATRLSVRGSSDS